MCTAMTKTVIRLLLLLNVCWLFAIVACSDEEPVKPAPGKRNYTWTIDTIAFPGSIQTLMSRIYGFSAKDVYVVGHNEIGSQGLMWHYDGDKWSNVTLGVNYGGTIPGAFSLRGITGSSNHDLWCYGDELVRRGNRYAGQGILIMYNGTVWSKIPHPDTTEFTSMVGLGFQDVMLSDNTGKIWHLKNWFWNKDSVSFPIENKTASGRFWLASLAGIRYDDIYGIAVYEDEPIRRFDKYFMHYDGISWSLKDSIKYWTGLKTDEKWGYRGLWMSPWGQLFSIGEKSFYRLIGGRWELMKEFSHSIGRCFGTSERNLFIIGFTISSEHLWHFNGQDWQEIVLPKWSNVNLLDIWCTEEEVFIVANLYDGIQRSLIIHGK